MLATPTARWISGASWGALRRRTLPSIAGSPRPSWRAPTTDRRGWPFAPRFAWLQTTPSFVDGWSCVTASSRSIRRSVVSSDVDVTPEVSHLSTWPGIASAVVTQHVRAHLPSQPSRSHAVGTAGREALHDAGCAGRTSPRAYRPTHLRRSHIDLSESAFLPTPLQYAAGVIPTYFGRCALYGRPRPARDTLRTWERAPQRLFLRWSSLHAPSAQARARALSESRSHVPSRSAADARIAHTARPIIMRVKFFAEANIRRSSTGSAYRSAAYRMAERVEFAPSHVVANTGLT